MHSKMNKLDAIKNAYKFDLNAFIDALFSATDCDNVLCSKKCIQIQFFMHFVCIQQCIFFFTGYDYDNLHKNLTITITITIT